MASLKLADQVFKAALKANQVLGSLKKAFVGRSAALWKRLYTTYVRPHLEYAVQAWCPYTRRDIATLEKVQRIATRLPKNLSSLAYDERCSRLGLTTLETRRMRGDLIEMFKIRTRRLSVAWHHEPVTGPTRAGRKRPQMRREIVVSCAQRYNFFNNRTAGSWNELPDFVVEAESVNQFKKRLDNFITTQTVNISASNLAMSSWLN